VKIFDRSIATLIRVRNQIDPAAVEQAIGILETQVKSSSMAWQFRHHGRGRSAQILPPRCRGCTRSLTPTRTSTAWRDHAQAGDAGGCDFQLRAYHRLAAHRGTRPESGADIVGITASGSPLAKLCTVACSPTWAKTRRVLAHDVSYRTSGARRRTRRRRSARRGPELLQQLEKTKRSLREKRVRELE